MELGNSVEGLEDQVQPNTQKTENNNDKKELKT